MTSESDCFPEVLGISSTTQLLLSRLFGKETTVLLEDSKFDYRIVVGEGQEILMGVKD